MADARTTSTSLYLQSLLRTPPPGKRARKPRQEVIEQFLESVETANAAQAEQIALDQALAATTPGLSGPSAVAAAASTSVDDLDSEDDDDDWGVGLDLSQIDNSAADDDSCTSSESSEDTAGTDADEEPGDSEHGSCVTGDDNGTTSCLVLDEPADDREPSSSRDRKRNRNLAQPTSAADRRLVTESRPVCMICLEGETVDNLILQCDKCGVEVHSACHGLPLYEDDGEEADGESVSWFCEPCKAGCRDAVCVACPIDGGVFKQTEVDGRWIHMVCAKYIEETGFGDSVSLSPVVVDRVPSSRWDCKPCAACPSSTAAASGVTIKCDAGLCREFYHPSCAQRLGLLQEVDDPDCEIPYYLHCPKHADPITAKAAARSYRAASKRASALARIAPEVLPLPILAKLTELREASLAERVAWQAANQDVVAAGKVLLKKVSERTRERLCGSQGSEEAASEPALSIQFVEDFISYPTRLKQLTTTCIEARRQSVVLGVRNRELCTEASELRSELAPLKLAHAQATSDSQVIRAVLGRIIGAELAPPVLSEKHGNPGVAAGGGEAGASMQPIPRCTMCESFENSFSMAQCDICKRYYHLTCHDPPLRSVPKKSKFKLWQCSNCDNPSGGEETDVPLVPLEGTAEGTAGSAPRQKRTIRCPQKFSPPIDAYYTNKSRKVEREWWARHDQQKDKKIDDSEQARAAALLKGRKRPRSEAISDVTSDGDPLPPS